MAAVRWIWRSSFALCAFADEERPAFWFVPVFVLDPDRTFKQGDSETHRNQHEINGDVKSCVKLAGVLNPGERTTRQACTPCTLRRAPMVSTSLTREMQKKKKKKEHQRGEESLHSPHRDSPEHT